MIPKLFQEDATACRAYKSAFLAHAQAHRDICEDVWTIYAPYADKQFGTAIKKDFHPRFWEMFLATRLLRNGFELVKTGDSGPEFFTEVNSQRIWFEAIAPTGGSGQDSVEPWETGVASSVPVDRVVLRITGALTEKMRQHERNIRSRRVRERDALIVCINAAGIPHAIFGTSPSYALRSFYGFGDLTLMIDRNTREIVDQFHQENTSVIKVSGASVPTNSFLCEKSRGCSAALYSVVNFFNLDRVRADDFELYHNPNAGIPVPEDVFRCYDQFRYMPYPNGTGTIVSSDRRAEPPQAFPPSRITSS